MGFECNQCKTVIHQTDHGAITSCDHHSLGPLKSQPANKRSDFMRVLAEFSRAENPVTKSVYREILSERLNREQRTENREQR